MLEKRKDIGSLTMRAEVLYITGAFGDGSFRLGVFLLDKEQVQNFQKVAWKKPQVSP